MMSNDVIDLCESPTNTADAATAAGAGVARLPSSTAAEVIDILEEEYNIEPRAVASYKTDPNERGRKNNESSSSSSTNSPSRKRQRPWKSDDNEDFAAAAAAAAGDDAVEIVGSKAPPQLELQVLDVFPDADVPPIVAMLQQHTGNPHAVQLVVAHMAEHGYEKNSSKNNKASKSGAAHYHQQGGDPVLHMMQKTPWKYDFMSTESFVPTANYVIQATDQLLCDFPFLSKKAAKGCLRKFSNHYAVAHDKILTAVKGTSNEDQQLELVTSAFSGKPLGKTEVESLKVVVVGHGTTPLKRPRKTKTKPLVTDSTLTEEIKFVKSKLHGWMNAIQTRQERQRKKEVSQKDGTAVDCSCCFDSYPMDDMVACRDEGHLFCQDCLKSVAENLIFGQGNLGIDKSTKQPALELKCFHGDGCSSGFHRACLEKALPPKSLQKYDEVQFQVSIEQAGLSDNVCSCPKCGFQADVPPEQQIFQCPVAECGYESCVKCGEQAHIPLRCNEVEKEKEETKGRLTVEEAISAAMIRKCPKCSKPFIKSSGCNKIRCGCGAYVCYLCTQSIKDYKHFCQTPHCKHKDCKKCPLYTKDEEDNARAMREAGYAAAEEVQKQSIASGKDNKNAEAGVKVDVEGILKTK